MRHADMDMGTDRSRRTWQRPRPRRVLVADADAQARRQLDSMLADAGYHVVGMASDRAMAGRVVRETRPDVVIMDMALTDGADGADDADEPRADARDNRPAPVFVLTASSHHEALAGARRVDVGAYLVKPVRAEALRPTIDIALARVAELRAVRARVETLDEELRTRQLVDRAKGVLMDTQGLSEAAAHRCLQRQSMETRRPLRDVAAAIIAGDHDRVCA